MLECELKEHSRRYPKPLAECLDVARVEFAFAPKKFRDDTLIANVRQIRLGESVRFHQEFELASSPDMHRYGLLSEQGATMCCRNHQMG